MHRSLLTPYILAREVHFAANAYERQPSHITQRIKPLKITWIRDNLWMEGRIKNFRFKLPATIPDLQLSINEYAVKHIIPMLLDKGILAVTARKALVKNG